MLLNGRLKNILDIEKNTYPMPIKTKGLDEVFVGRIRNDFSQIKTINL